MHVAVLTPDDERPARELAAALSGAGHRVRLITTHRALRRTEAVEDGVEVVRWPRALDERLRRRLYDDGLVHCATAFRELLREPPDVCHALHHAGGAAAARLRARTGTPAVMTLTAAPRREALASRRMRLTLARRAVLGATVVTAPDEEVAGAAERWLGATGVRVLEGPGAFAGLYAEVAG